MPDPNAGITAAFEICAALERRRQSGREAATSTSRSGRPRPPSRWRPSWATSCAARSRRGRTAGTPGWRPMPSSASRETTSGSPSPARATPSGEPSARSSSSTWPRMRASPRLAARKANEDALEALVGEGCVTRERWELTRALQARGIAAFPALTAQDIALRPPPRRPRHTGEPAPARGGPARARGPPLPHAASPRRRPPRARRCSASTRSRCWARCSGYTSEQIAALADEGILD